MTPDTSRCARHAVPVLRTAGKLGFAFMKRACRVAITVAPLATTAALLGVLLEVLPVTAASPDLTAIMERVLPDPWDPMVRDLREAMVSTGDPQVVDLLVLDPLVVRDLPEDCRDGDD